MKREKVAEQKRREERANRRVMDNERERNRQRKLGTLTGREWDVDKPEEQTRTRGSQYRRGMHGGVSGYTRKGLGDSIYSQQEPLDDRDGNRGSARGRGGSGRGGHHGQDPADDTPSDVSPVKTPTSEVDNEADFPSLPGGEKKEAGGKEQAGLDESSNSLSPVTGGTWADQVESQRE